MNRLVSTLAVTFVVMALHAQAEAEVVIQADNAAIKTEGGPVAGGWNLWSNGHVGQAVRITTAGKYHVIVRAWGSPAGGVWPEMALLVDGLAVKTVSVEGAQSKDYSCELELAAGDHEIAAAFLNDALVGEEDRNLYQGSFIPGGGMLRTDLSPKPVYEQLKRLIHEEWKTKTSGTSDAEGRFAFRGFLGTYRITVAIPGKPIEKQFHLGKGDVQEITISLDK